MMQSASQDEVIVFSDNLEKLSEKKNEKFRFSSHIITVQYFKVSFTSDLAKPKDEIIAHVCAISWGLVQTYNSAIEFLSLHY